jgi:hypothetical protein
MAAIRSEAHRIDAGWAWWWHYAQRGFYADQLEAFLDVFPSDQLLILPYDEIRRDSYAVVTNVSEFLGVDPTIDTEISDRQNDSYIARSTAHATIRNALSDRSISKVLLPARVRGALKRRLDRLTMHRSTIDESDYRALQAYFSDDVRRVADMTGLNLSAWLA